VNEAQRITMPPGIYTRDQIASYDAIDAVNYSSLKMLARSPKHYQHHMRHGAKETRPMFKGTLAHVAILEPDRIDTDYAVFTGPRRAGKAWEAFEEENAGKTIVKANELAQALAIRDAVRADALASSYLENGPNEVTVVWVDDETGLACKGRLDHLELPSTGVDLKTTRDASPMWFGRDVARLQYHVQAAMYFDALAVLTRESPRFVDIAIESFPPHDVVTYDLPEPVTTAGRNEYRRLLRLLVECRAKDSWPGIGNGFEQALTLPAWVFPDEEELELTIGGESFAV
jgi:hypothetical protein